MRGVADELHTQYLLGFAPPKRDGKVHDISVKVKGRREAARAQELRRAEIILLVRSATTGSILPARRAGSHAEEAHCLVG